MPARKQLHPILIVALLLALTANASESLQDSEVQSIRKAARYLWSLQSDDGGWHSRTYGLLRSGQALTPFVLNTLLQVPKEIEPPAAEKIARAIKFIKTHLSNDGALGMSEQILHDYPNYATAQGVEALTRVGGEDESVDKMLGFLRHEQFVGSEWTREQPAYGAWGMGGIARTLREPGHLDLSMTRHVLQALRTARPEVEDDAYQAALMYLQRCQNFKTSGANEVDGGFFFSTVVLESNKAGPEGTVYRSYGTATADGILALLACGVPANDERVQAAAGWLLKHPGTDCVPGFPPEFTKKWNTGLQFYYYACVARVFHKLKLGSKSRDFQRQLATSVIKAQRSDGAWVNPNFLVKEDDPLIATTFGLVALIDLSGEE